MKKPKQHNRIRAALRRNSLASEMWIVILSALAIFGVAFVISGFLLTRQYRKDFEIRASETLINSVAESIRAGVDNYKDISRLIMLNESVMDFMRADRVNAGMANDAKYGIMDVLNVSTNLDSVFIFRTDGAYVSTGRAEYNVHFAQMDSLTWQQPILEARGGAVMFMNANRAIYRKNGEQFLTIARSVYDIYSQDRTGLLLLNVSTKMLEMIVNAQTNPRLCILAQDGTYLTGDENLADYYNPNAVPEVIIHRELREKGRYYMVSSYAMAEIPLIVLCANDAPPAALTPAYIFVLLLLLAAFAVAIFIAAAFVTRRINKPIYDLAQAMEHTKESGWMEKVDLEAPRNEIGTLVNSYNSVIDYLNDLFTQLLENEKSVQRAEMRVLNEQIKPHFLYNSLGTISYMAFEDGAQDVYEALETLSNFYRNFLSKGDREITVRREISIVRDYLSLQKLRYGEIIRDEYDIAEETQDLMMPKLLLQPLVENCIYHGIRPKGEEGVIRISTRLADGEMRIEVYDDGVGMSAEEIARVMAGEAGEDEKEGHSGFGLKGTIDRIRYYCNDPDIVTIESEPGEYTRISFRIPQRVRSAEEEEVTSEARAGGASERKCVGENYVPSNADRR
ncbi:MAG: sensor histidine kinase [Lachnospiraceae bacterium]|nr:sensor histidine kinase [Lachnospiraceae bacterium]